MNCTVATLHDLRRAGRVNAQCAAYRGVDTRGRELGRVTLPTQVHGYMGVSPDAKYGVATVNNPTRVYLFRLPDPPEKEE